jgi:hypothetical protein
LELLAGRRVDPVTKGRLKPWIRPHVLACGTESHAYFDLDWQIVWDSATADIPKLRQRVLDILRMEFSDSEVD